MKWHQTHCVICGYDFKSEVRDENGVNRSSVICPACYAEVGIEDENLEVARTYRKNWIDRGCPWEDDFALPGASWEPQTLLKTIPEEWQ